MLELGNKEADDDEPGARPAGVEHPCHIDSV